MSAASEGIFYTLMNDLVVRFLEKHLDPLDGQQAIDLNKLNIEGLVLYPDKWSLKHCTHPKSLFAFHDGTYIGTAYGSKFVISTDLKPSLQGQELVNRIIRTYLDVNNPEVNMQHRRYNNTKEWAT